MPDIGWVHDGARPRSRPNWTQSDSRSAQNIGNIFYVYFGIINKTRAYNLRVPSANTLPTLLQEFEFETDSDSQSAKINPALTSFKTK